MSIQHTQTVKSKKSAIGTVLVFANQDDVLMALGVDKTITVDEAKALRASLEAQENGGKGGNNGFYPKVAPSGAVSVYGLQRMPQTLYAQQHERYLCPEFVIDDVTGVERPVTDEERKVFHRHPTLAFIRTHADNLSYRDEKGGNVPPKNPLPNYEPDAAKRKAAYAKSQTAAS